MLASPRPFQLLEDLPEQVKSLLSFLIKFITILKKVGIFKAIQSYSASIPLFFTKMLTIT